MKNRFYLFMTILLGIFSFSQSEARTMDPNSGAQVGPPSWSVKIPVKNNLTIVKKVEEANSALGSVSTTRGRIPKPTGESTSSSSQIPKQGNTQSSDQGNIFDRWGNSKNKGTK